MQNTFRSRQFESHWIPARRPTADGRRKLLIVLHGRGDSLRSFSSIQSELGRPEFDFLLLNAPLRYRDGFSWYDLEPRHAPGIRAARQGLFALIQELHQAGFASRDLYWLGHSQGALMVCDLLMNHPDAFGGAIGVSGYVWFFRGWREKAMRAAAARTPWVMTYGIKDRVIRPTEVREDLARLLAHGFPVTVRAFAKGHDFDFQAEIPFLRRWLRRPTGLRGTEFRL